MAKRPSSMKVESGVTTPPIPNNHAEDRYSSRMGSDGIITLPPSTLLRGEHYRDYLTIHAKKTVWCNPYNNRQYILSLSRISARHGAINEFEMFERRMLLPTPKDTYHIFMIGGNYPRTFNFIEKVEEWIPIEEMCNDYNIVIRCYNDYGQLIPLGMIYYAKEYDDNLIIAIKSYNSSNVNLSTDNIYIHTDSSYIGFFDTAGKEDSNTFFTKTINVKSGRRNVDEIKTPFLEKPNFTLRHLFSDGQLRNKFAFESLEEFHSAEIQLDNRVSYYMYFRLDELKTYQSTLDMKNKYLLMLSKDRTTMPFDDFNKVIYRDDVEIFLFRVSDESVISDNFKHGLYQDIERAKIVKSAYYHRNEEDSLRHVTHQSYGIPVDYIMNYLEHFGENHDYADKWFLKVIVRNEVEEFNKDMPYDSHHMLSLHTLPEKERLEVMTSTDSRLSFWKARVLEHAGINYLFRCYEHEITPDKVVDAYGYDASTMAVSYPYIKRVRYQGVDFFPIPVGLAEAATIYEYDEHGKLLGWYHHTNGFRYSPVNGSTYFIEALSGYGSQNPSFYRNPTEMYLSDTIRPRSYIAQRDSSGAIVSDYVFEKSHFTDNGNGRTIFDTSDSGVDRLVITDERFLSHDIAIDASETGYYRFTLVRMDNDKIPMAIELPMQRINVWVNGHALVQDVDFFVDFPHVSIVTKKYTELDESGNELPIFVTYRCLGFPDLYDNGKYGFMRPEEIGFSNEIGKLSADKDITKYNNRVVRISHGGKVILSRDVTHDEITGVIDTGDNGVKPYSIEDLFISLRGFSGSEFNYDEYYRDRERRKEVSSLLSAKMSDLFTVDKVTMKERYPVYSPFLSAIINKILRDIDKYRDFDYRNKVKLERLVGSYKYLLNADPAYLGFDEDYIICHPRAILSTHEPMVVPTRILTLIEHIANSFLTKKVEIKPWFKVVRTRKGENE